MAVNTFSGGGTYAEGLLHLWRGSSGVNQPATPTAAEIQTYFEAVLNARREEEARQARINVEGALRDGAARRLVGILSPHCSLDVARELAFRWNIADAELGRELAAYRISAHFWADRVGTYSPSYDINPRATWALVWNILSDERPEWRAELADHRVDLPIDMVMEKIHEHIVAIFGSWCKLQKYVRNNK